jgi:hypothetical protein
MNQPILPVQCHHHDMTCTELANGVHTSPRSGVVHHLKARRNYQRGFGCCVPIGDLPTSGCWYNSENGVHTWDHSNHGPPRGGLRQLAAHAWGTTLQLYGNPAIVCIDERGMNRSSRPSRCISLPQKVFGRGAFLGRDELHFEVFQERRCGFHDGGSM